MKIVIFGSGLIGSQVAAKLADAGHDVKALGRGDGIDITTGAGIAEAVEGADVVVDLTNSPSWSDDDVLAFFRDGTGHILAAEEKAGVGHHVILSIVGADRPARFRVHASQGRPGRPGQSGPDPLHDRPIDPNSSSSSPESPTREPPTAPSTQRRDICNPSRLDVVSHVAEVVTAAPRNGTVEIAGPEPLGIDELVRRLFLVTGDKRSVISDPEAGYFGAKTRQLGTDPDTRCRCMDRADNIRRVACREGLTSTTRATSGPHRFPRRR